MELETIRFCQKRSFFLAGGGTTTQHGTSGGKRWTDRCNQQEREHEYPALNFIKSVRMIKNKQTKKKGSTRISPIRLQNKILINAD